MALGKAWIDCTKCSPECNDGRTERKRVSQKTDGYLQVTRGMTRLLFIKRTSKRVQFKMRDGTRPETKCLIPEGNIHALLLNPIEPPPAEERVFLLPLFQSAFGYPNLLFVLNQGAAIDPPNKDELERKP
jgi:hypothetical protein